jgi:membrane associated rhomboid family serine protease
MAGVSTRGVEPGGSGMFPIRDHNPSQRTPWVTRLLIGLNVLVFLSYLPLFGDERGLMVFFYDWGVVPARIVTGEGWGGLVSSQFLHGGWLHLGFNMLFLWVFGDNLEEEWGHLPYLAFYLACGVLAGLAQVLADPYSPVPMVGASGAIAGVLGGYLLLFPRARIDVLFIIVILIRIVPLPAWLVLGAWFGLQLFGGFAADSATGGVAHWAHAGGFVAGVALTVPLWLRRGGPGFWRRTHGVPPHPEATYRMVPTRVPRTSRRRAEAFGRGGRDEAGPGPWGAAQPEPRAQESLFPKVPRKDR